jgi:two-component system, LytTR family, response regulator
MKIHTIIIEDEEPARSILKNYLAPYSEIELIGEFSEGFSGLKAINELKPDLVFLDIQMPKLTGFEILELAEHKPIIIFTTAYDQFAIKAFEANATDYLLKPFTRERFADALTKAKARFKNNEIGEIKSVLQAMDEKPELINRIAVRFASKIHLIPVEEILFLEADGDYVKIHTGDGSFLKEKTMKYFEFHLNPAQFMRIHRSYIVNVNYILRLEYYDKENHIAILKNNERLKVSDSGYKLLRKALNL